jgi:hypothetical protein
MIVMPTYAEVLLLGAKLHVYVESRGRERRNEDVIAQLSGVA